ncbi:MAG: ABC transporter ATP-binding protein [Clostridia bacterium]|nr:ABC transporter ATP-binding protein [Clostridia bacterium]
METKNVIEAQNLSVIIKDRFLVKNASFFIKKGECVGVLGEDQSGKTSLIKAISGSLPINAGQAFVLGNDIFEDKKVLAKVSTCFDPPIFFKYQTVYDNMKYISRLSESCDDEKIFKVLNKFGIAHRLKTRVLFLPYHEKKLMSLALAFLTNPEILLLDEPFKNLPKESLEIVKKSIKEATQNGTTVIITSRNFEDLEDSCTRFIFMENREIKTILKNDECEHLSSSQTFTFVKVKYPHLAGKLLIDDFGMKVKILDKRVLFEADEDSAADIVRYLTKNKIAIYSAGYLSKKAEKIFASLTPYFKEEDK